MKCCDFQNGLACNAQVAGLGTVAVMAGTQFQDQVAIVTGAAGGIGSAVTRRILRDGARVVLVDIDRLQLEAQIEQIGPDAARVLAAPADVTQEADVAEYVRRTAEHFGRVDLFFNNAGVESRISMIADTELAEFERVMAVNVRGVFLGLREVLRVLREQGTGAPSSTRLRLPRIRGPPVRRRIPPRNTPSSVLRASPHWREPSLGCG